MKFHIEQCKHYSWCISKNKSAVVCSLGELKRKEKSYVHDYGVTVHVSCTHFFSKWNKSNIFYICTVCVCNWRSFWPQEGSINLDLNLVIVRHANKCLLLVVASDNKVQIKHVYGSFYIKTSLLIRHRKL